MTTARAQFINEAHRLVGARLDEERDRQGGS